MSPSGMTPTERTALREAVDLARRGTGTTSPNPVVGCVVLDASGAVVGRGWHERAGGPHAEVAALADAGDAARGATAVVTLEPCRHTGRTGPCVDALREAGITRVVVAVPDPTAQAGGGADVLRAAGVDVEVLAADDPDRGAAERANRAWLTWARRGRPVVTWKVGQTLDGRTAAADGTSRWITSSESRHEVHALRAAVDAVLVGGGTLAVDDPHLAVRDATGGIDRIAAQPLRVVVDTRAEIPLTARVLDDAAPTLVVAARGSRTARLTDAGIDVLEVPVAADGLDLDALVTGLGERGVRHVLLEGGATLAGSMVARGLVDEVVAYVAPTLLGAGPASLVETGVGTLGDAVHLAVTDVSRCGPDVRITADVIAPETTDQPSTTQE